MLLPVLSWARGNKDKNKQPAQPAAIASPFFTGDGGKGMSIAILAPQAIGLAENLNYLPALVQGEFVSNFSGYSAISVLDRQHLDEQYAELFSGYYSDNAKAGMDLGHLTPTTHILGGNITRTATGYTLQMQITRTADKMIEASPSSTISFAKLDNLLGIRRTSLDLLEKMGVKPTERTRTELAGGAAANHVSAQTTLARGITAQQQGTVVEALSYFIQSTNYDPNLTEAASRMNILNANISSGNIGVDARNEITWRQEWVARLQETDTFYTNYIKEPQPYYLVFSTNVQKGTINWENETITLSFTINLIPDNTWKNPTNGVINAVKIGFMSTGKAREWQIEWPAKNSNGGNTVFVSQNRNYTVVAEIINDKGTSIGNQIVTIPYGYEIKDGIIIELKQWNGIVSFPLVKVDVITDILYIRITSIDGLTAENAARQKNISIMPLDENYFDDNYVACFFASKPFKMSDNLYITVGVIGL
jgi:hypothetical protein